MCNRLIARFIDFHRIAAVLAGISSFEEFTDRPRFEPLKSPLGSAPSVQPHSGDGSGKTRFIFNDEHNERRPTDLVSIVRVIGNEMRIDHLKWGLVPPHEPEPEVSYSTFNAKAETVRTTRGYAHAWKERQRCLVPVEAFFEWKGTRSPKQKYRISVKNESQFCLAGLWERWERGATILETFTIITTTANELVAEIHDKKRMPVIIAPEIFDRWLRSTGDVSDLLKPYPSELMEAVPVGKRAKPPDGGQTSFDFGA